MSEFTDEQCRAIRKMARDEIETEIARFRKALKDQLTSIYNKM